jgi:hypothetical protein
MEVSDLADGPLILLGSGLVVVSGPHYCEDMKTNTFSGIQRIAAATSLALLLSFGVATPSLSEEYVPPPEAFEGPGGWAVIDPTTGVVYGVIVGDWNAETWEEVKNTRTVDGYMGCPAPCELRFQTRATADGNVAGWHGTQTNVDADGNATQTNDGSVRFDESTGNFQINNQTGDSSTSQTLVPEKTARDENGEGRSMDLGTGIVDIRTAKKIVSGSESASVDTYRSDLSDTTVDAVIALPGLGSEGTLEYVFGSRESTSLEPVSELGQIRTDLISILMGMGFTKTVESVDEETGEESSTEVLDESNAFVGAIMSVTEGIVDFLSSLLGFFSPSNPEPADA